MRSRIVYLIVIQSHTRIRVGPYTHTLYYYDDVHTLELCRNASHKHHHSRDHILSKRKIHSILPLFGIWCACERNGASQQKKHRNKINKRRRRVNAWPLPIFLEIPSIRPIPLFCCSPLDAALCLLHFLLFVVRLHEITPFSVALSVHIKHTSYTNTSMWPLRPSRSDAFEPCFEP